MKVNDVLNEAWVAELNQEFDLVESIITNLARINSVDPEVLWEDLESLTDDELYVFAVTQQPIMEDTTKNHGDPDIRPGMKTQHGTVVSVRGNTVTVKASNGELTTVNAHDIQQGVSEDWQKVNKRDRTAGMSQKAVNAYRRENPGSKLKTAVTTKPGKLKRGSKASKRRKSYCSRSRGQMKMHSIDCSKTPDKAICAARRRWNC